MHFYRKNCFSVHTWLRSAVRDTFLRVSSLKTAGQMRRPSRLPLGLGSLPPSVFSCCHHASRRMEVSIILDPYFVATNQAQVQYYLFRLEECDLHGTRLHGM